MRVKRGSFAFSAKEHPSGRGGNETDFVNIQAKPPKRKAPQRVKSQNKPRKNLYASGRRFEYQVRNDLRYMGFAVIRSAGSKTPIDLIAIATGDLRFIQCKANGVMSQTERGELCLLATMVQAKPVLAKKNGRGIFYEYLRAGSCQTPQDVKWDKTQKQTALSH